jgi:hypothetical protein
MVWHPVETTEISTGRLYAAVQHPVNRAQIGAHYGAIPAQNSLIEITQGAHALAGLFIQPRGSFRCSLTLLATLEPLTCGLLHIGGERPIFAAQIR